MAKTGLIIGILVVCCIISIVVSLALYFTNTVCSLGSWAGSNCSSSNSTTPSTTTPSTTTPSTTTPSPGPTPSPRQQLLSSATALKVAETDLGTTAFQPDNMPSFSLTSTPSFSMSFWIKVPNGVSKWMGIFGGNGFYMSFDGLGGRTLAIQAAHGPAVPLPQPSNWIYVGFPDGNYHHVVLVVNGATAATYLDGAIYKNNWTDYGPSTQGSPNWIGSPIAMSFNPFNNPLTGNKIKECYWFNTPLTASDVSTLYSSGSTTSTYMPETSAEVTGYTF